MTTHDDAPTARSLDLQLDRLTRDEIAFLAFVIETLRRGELVTTVGLDDARVLERLALKLAAHRAGKEDA